MGEPARVWLRALGTSAVLWTADAAALPDATAALVDELDAIDRACSRFRDDSELARVNRAAGTEVALGPLLTEAIRVALRAAAATDGLVDPTIGRSLALAGYDRDFALVRRRAHAETRVRFVPAGGWRRVELDCRRRTMRVPAGVELDLGATAKALAADRAARAAAEASGSGVLVSLGGDLSAAGPVPAGGWSVRIADDHAVPLDCDGPLVSVSGGGLATSSVAVRRWRAGGRELHHILDPRTGAPAVDCWRTVSVAAASCVDANTASTAAVLLGERAPAWLAERHLPARLVRLGGETVTVAGWPEERA